MVFKCGGRKREYSDGTLYCEYESQEPWYNQACPGCGSRVFDIMRFGTVTKRENRITAATLHEAPATVYIPTGCPEFDRVMGGGLVAGSSILLSGGRGTGKSSLLMMIADGVATGARSKVLYASGEEGAEGVGKIVRRLNIKNEYIDIMDSEHACDIHAIIARAEEIKPTLTVFDSLQVITAGDCDGNEGSSSQINAVVNTINGHLIRSKQCAIIVAHMNGQGEIAGGQTAQHLVDTISRFDKEETFEDYEEDVHGRTKEPLRKLSIDGKNRNGSTNETALFEMLESGLLRPKRPKTRLIRV